MSDRDPRPDRAAATDAGVSPEMGRARRLASTLDVDHVAVVLLAGPQHRAVMTGSDPDLVAFGDMAVTVGESPAHDVLRTGRPCVVEDLPAGTDRWPLLLTAYPVPDHLRSLLVVPVAPDQQGPPEDVLGVVVLARDRYRPFTSSEVAGAALTAQDIATTLLARAAESDGPALDEELDGLIDPRADVVPRAVGVLSHLEGVDRHEALRRLRTRAFGRGRTLQEVAADLLAEQA